MSANGFYIIDNFIIDEYGPKIGVYGVAVYNLIVKYTNDEGTNAFPSYQTIANKLGMSRPKAIETVNLLIEVGLIEKEKRTDLAGDATSNLYSLVRFGGKQRLPDGDYGLLGGKRGLPPGKPRLPQVVNVVYQGGKRGLPYQYPMNNTQSERESIHDDTNGIAKPSLPLSQPESALVPHKPVFNGNGNSVKASSKRATSNNIDPRSLVNGRIPSGAGKTPVEVYYERHSATDKETTLTAPLEDDLMAAVTDLDKWRMVVTAWHQAGYKPKNVNGQLEWYRNGVPKQPVNGQSSQLKQEPAYKRVKQL